MFYVYNGVNGFNEASTEITNTVKIVYTTVDAFGNKRILMA